MDAHELLHLMTDATRHRILTTLRQEETTVSQLVKAIGGEQSNVSHHLRILRDAGLVKARRAGRQRIYRLADPQVERLLTAIDGLAKDLEKATYYANLDLSLDPAFHGYG